MANILQMKTNKWNNPCRKIKPSDPKGKFLYPSAEYADTHTTNPHGDVGRYLQDIERYFADNLDGLAKEIWYFKGIYAKQFQFFTHSIIQADLKERRRQWCKETINLANQFAKSKNIVF